MAPLRRTIAVWFAAASSGFQSVRGPPPALVARPSTVLERELVTTDGEKLLTRAEETALGEGVKEAWVSMKEQREQDRKEFEARLHRENSRLFRRLSSAQGKDAKALDRDVKAARRRNVEASQRAQVAQLKQIGAENKKLWARLSSTPKRIDNEL